MTPSPVYPWLQVQVKLPGVLAQAALVAQLASPVSHSLISDIRIFIIIACYMLRIYTLTIACEPIPIISLITGADRDHARGIGAAGSISVTDPNITKAWM